MIEEIRITSLHGRGSLLMKRGDYEGYWLGPVDWGQVEGAHQTYSYYNQIGASIVSTSVRPRPMSIVGWVMDSGTGEMQARCDFLDTFISPVEDYELEYQGKKIKFRPDISVYYPSDIAKNNEKVRRFQIEATCPFPLFSDSEDTALPFDQTVKLFRFPTDFGQFSPLVFGNASNEFRVNANNRGGFPTGVIIRIRFLGDVSDPRIRNLTTDKIIGLRRPFRRGELLEISTIPGSKKMTLYRSDGTTENLIKYRDYQTAWMQLVPGMNHLAIECSDPSQRTNMEVTLYFTPLYLEVE